MQKAVPPNGKQANPLLETRNRLEQAEKLRQAGKFEKAQRQCESILKRYPKYSAAHHTLGLALADKRDYSRALTHLIQASMLNPKDWTTMTALAGVYLRLGAAEMAMRTLEQAQLRRPDDVSILATLGTIYREGREYELAEQTLHKVMELDDSLPGARLTHAQCCIHLGRLRDAANTFESLVKDGHRQISLLYSLIQLPAAFVSTDVMSLLDEATPDSKNDKQDFTNSLAFTRAVALDKASKPSEAWENLINANLTLSHEYREEYEKEKVIQQTVLAGTKRHPVIKQPPGKPSEKCQSLFILGPSRSGKTTMEYLASTLDGLKRGYENPITENSVRQAFQTAALPPRDRVVELPPALNDLFLDFYDEELEQRAAGAQVFTNTHPGQIHSVLRLASVLPNARFIFVKRDLDDIMLRIFMTKYAAGNAYGYDINNIRDHVTWYYQMIDLLAERLLHISMVINYEDIIDNPAQALQAVAELCGLHQPNDQVPTIGNDRSCADPYKKFIGNALAN